MLVLGLGGAVISIVSGNVSMTISGMSLSAIVGVILNLVLKNELDDEDTYTPDAIMDDVDNEPEIILNEKSKKKKARK